MDAKKFDALTRLLSTSDSRRRLVGAVAAFIGLGVAPAVPKGKKKVTLCLEGQTIEASKKKKKKLLKSGATVGACSTSPPVVPPPPAPPVTPPTPPDTRFGDGRDGVLTPADNETYNGARASFIGNGGERLGTAGNASLRNGMRVLIHQSQGSGAGAWELNEVAAGGGGNFLELLQPLTRSYGAGAQIVEMKQFTSVSVFPGVRWRTPAWSGSEGGILAFFCNGDTTVAGTLEATGAGYRGGSGSTRAERAAPSARQGESIPGIGVISATANQSGGGGGTGGGDGGSGGGGGGNFKSGTTGANGQGTGGNGGIAVAADALVFGGGGGGGQGESNCGANGPGGGDGGAGGGLVFIVSRRITGSGTIASHGAGGGNGFSSGLEGSGGGGGGAGGSVFLRSAAAIGTSSRVVGGPGGPSGGPASGAGGTGGDGRVRVDAI